MAVLNRFVRLFRHAQSPATLSSLEAYKRWAANYPPQAHNALMQAEETAMKSLFLPVHDQIVLDLACGTGRYGRLALEQGAKCVVGVDNSAPMLRASVLERRALATTDHIPFASHSVDVVLCGLALGHMADLKPTTREMARVLKPGGWALVSDFHPFIFLNGQKRTFDAPDGRTYAVEHYPHLYANYHRAVVEAGLTIDAVVEPRLGYDEMVRFADEQTQAGTPVIIAFRFRK